MEYKTWVKGDDYREEPRLLKTYGISRIISGSSHYNIIEVYNDKKLRDSILKLLNTAEEAKMKKDGYTKK